VKAALADAVVKQMSQELLSAMEGILRSGGDCVDELHAIRT
jgi:hypothetical protein